MNIAAVKFHIIFLVFAYAHFEYINQNSMGNINPRSFLNYEKLDSICFVFVLILC